MRVPFSSLLDFIIGAKTLGNITLSNTFKKVPVSQTRKKVMSILV